MSIVRNVSNVNLVDVLLHFLRFNWESRKGLKSLPSCTLLSPTSGDQLD